MMKKKQDEVELDFFLLEVEILEKVLGILDLAWVEVHVDF
jgi:hypothetical protein